MNVFKAFRALFVVADALGRRICEKFYENKNSWTFCAVQGVGHLIVVHSGDCGCDIQSLFVFPFLRIAGRAERDEGRWTGREALFLRLW